MSVAECTRAKAAKAPSEILNHRIRFQIAEVFQVAAPIDVLLFQAPSFGSQRLKNLRKLCH